jgi:hypothetical protein
VGERMTEFEHLCAHMHFAANRLALQAISQRIPAISLRLATSAYRVRLILIQSGAEEQTRRLAMNNFVVASELFSRLSTFVKDEWKRPPSEITDGGEGLAELNRFHYQLETDRCFMRGLQGLYDAFGYRSRIEELLDVDAFHFISCNTESSPAMRRLEEAVKQSHVLIARAKALFAEYAVAKEQQKERQYEKRKSQVSLDHARLKALKDEQSQRRSDLASLAIALRHLPVLPIRYELMNARDAFHCDRSYPEQADLVMVTNLVYAQKVLCDAFAVEWQIARDVPLEDDTSVVGLQDRYNAIRHLVEFAVVHEEQRAQYYRAPAAVTADGQ